MKPKLVMFKLIIVLITLSFAIGIIMAEDDPQCKAQIIEYHQKSEIAKAFTIAKECCDNKSDGYSCNQVGFLIDLDMVPNENDALPYYEKSCNSGYFGGCKSIASKHKQSGDKENAIKYYQKACDLKDPDSCVEAILLE